MKTGVFPFERFFKEYDVWDFHPLDQGGRLVQFQLVGSEKDADIVAAMQRRISLRPGESRSSGTVWNPPNWRKVSGSIGGITSQALRDSTGSQKTASLLDDLLKLFRHWTIDNPVPVDLPQYFQSRKYNWRDMQVAWRTQNLIWCYFLGQHGFTGRKRWSCKAAIETHARVLLAYFGKQSLSAGNHQSHGALAMLHVGILFPDLADAAELRDKALEILQHHLEAAFFADGNSVEFRRVIIRLSPQTFVTRICCARPTALRYRIAGGNDSRNSMILCARSGSRTGLCRRLMTPARCP